MDLVNLSDLRIYKDGIGKLWFKSGEFKLYLEDNIEYRSLAILDALQRLSYAVNRKSPD